MAQKIPEGFNTVNTYLIVKDAKEAIGFYQKALGAEAGVHMPGPGGQGTMHAELRIGNSTVMLTDENPAWEMKAPETLGGSPTSMHLYVDDADKAFQRAVDAGCKVTAPLMDAFWGDRYGKVMDPYGHQWGFATHIEDVEPADMEKRATEFFSQMSGGE